MTSALLLPMAAHLALTAILYALLTLFRAPAVWGLGRRPDGSNPWAALEPRTSANLKNQFEWPLFFHIGCVLLMLQPPVGPAAIITAWIFIAGRVLHSAVQILTPQVRLRGVVFTINFVAVLGMWAILLLGATGAR
ncbi:MAG: MAPEG family protein [Xanthomonadales bacterium]|nr:MAPEG family protein [Xanthomonadales bacterium]